ncbi:MAG: YdcF family protein [Nitrospira sp.]
MIAILKHLILPSTLITWSAVAGLFLLCARSTRKWGVSLSLAAFAAYIFFASGPVSFFLLGYLEYRIVPSAVLAREGIRTVVVLAAHAEFDNHIPLSSRVNGAAAVRLLEALSLFQSSPESTVIVSGGGEVPIIMRDVLVSAGIPSERIVVDAESFRTVESAVHLSVRLGTAPFLLVTSAGHMPRAMAVFQKAGMSPLAVPTHYVTKQNWLAIQYLPSPVHLEYSDWAVSEYAALLWYRMKGWV